MFRFTINNPTKNTFDKGERHLPPPPQKKLLNTHLTILLLLHAANLRHGTDGFTSPPKEGMLRIFFALKSPTASAGFEPANLGTKGQHATSRPPKPLVIYMGVNF
jgi:hypothetical protein